MPIVSSTVLAAHLMICLSWWKHSTLWVDWRGCNLRESVFDIWILRMPGLLTALNQSSMFLRNERILLLLASTIIVELSWVRKNECKIRPLIILYHILILPTIASLEKLSCSLFSVSGKHMRTWSMGWCKRLLLPVNWCSRLHSEIAFTALVNDPWNALLIRIVNKGRSLTMRTQKSSIKWVLVTCSY